MANELVLDYATGNTLYAVLFDATGQVWNGSAFATPSSANWTDYDIAMTEVATATGIYRGSMPAVASGYYTYFVRKQAGASPAVTDDIAGSGTVEWTGSVIATPAGTGLYSTVATLKTRLSISDTDDDTTLGVILQGVCRAIDGHCGQSFYMDDAASVRYFTAQDKHTVFVDPLVSVTALATDSDIDRTYSQTWAATDYDLMPANASSRNRPYTWIEMTPDGDYNFPLCSLGVKLTAVWGWPAVPAAVGEAALLWAERLYKRKDAPFGIASFIEAGEMRLIKEIDPDVQTLLKPFVRLF